MVQQVNPIYLKRANQVLEVNVNLTEVFVQPQVGHDSPSSIFKVRCGSIYILAHYRNQEHRFNLVGFSCMFARKFSFS